jgi:TPR repeat protein
MAAVEALKKAADQGNAVAQYNLGTMVCQLLRIPNALQTSAHLFALNLLLLLIA